MIWAWLNSSSDSHFPVSDGLLYHPKKQYCLEKFLPKLQMLPTSLTSVEVWECNCKKYNRGLITNTVMLLLYLNINLSTRISPRHCCNCTRASTNLVEKDCRCNFGRSLTYNNSFDCAITYRLPNISFFNFIPFHFNISPHLNDLLPYLQFQSVPRLLFLQATRSHRSIKPPSPLTNHQWFSPLWVGQLSLGIFYYTYWLPTFHFISFHSPTFHFISFHNISFPFIFISFSNISFHFQHFISFPNISFHFIFISFLCPNTPKPDSSHPQTHTINSASDIAGPNINGVTQTHAYDKFIHDNQTGFLALRPNTTYLSWAWLNSALAFLSPGFRWTLHHQPKQKFNKNSTGICLLKPHFHNVFYFQTF